MESRDRDVSRRHHTVPKFYLRGFALEDQISTVQLPGKRRFKQSIADASVGKDFYNLEGHPDGDDAVERALSELEGAAALVFRKVANGEWPLAFQDRMLLGHFVSLQAARVPVQRRTGNQLAAQLLRLQIGVGGKESLRRRLETHGASVSDEELESIWTSATRPEGAPIELSNAVHIQQMFKTTESILKYIVGRPWTLVRFDRRSLLTSDDPVALVPDPEIEPWRGVGYLTAWGITYPFTRKLGLLMSSPKAFIEKEIAVEHIQRGEADLTLNGTTALENFFNDNTISNTSEWLFHHPDDDSLLPDRLPDPAPFATQMDGLSSREFTGEPWFKKVDTSPTPSRVEPTGTA